MDWKSWESQALAAYLRAIAIWFQNNPSESIDAICLHESYREQNANICVPHLAVRLHPVKSSLSQPDTTSVSWNPADWTDRHLAEQSTELMELEAQVIEEANRSSPAHWQKTEKKFLESCTRIVKAIRQELSNHPQINKHLVVYFSDEEGGLDLLKKCVTAAQFKKHFSEYELPSPPLLTSCDDVELSLFDNLITNEATILQYGSRAIEPLVSRLNDPQNGWLAASLLARLNQPSDYVLGELRKRLEEGSKFSSAMAISLSKLGDREYLLDKVSQTNLQAAIVIGLLSPLKAKANPPVSLDYSAAINLLDRHDDTISTLVNEQLKPGSVTLEIVPADVPEAFRGLEYPHEIIQLHAITVLGDRALGKKLSESILPKLVSKLHHPSATVRRITLLSLSYWKAACKPYHEEMRKCLEDPVSIVRSTAGAIFNS